MIHILGNKISPRNRESIINPTVILKSGPILGQK